MNNSSFPLVSIVVAYYNELEITRSCLQRLCKQTYPNLEIIFIDNGSKENISSVLRLEFPEVKHIRLEENLGFSGGYNYGLRISSGKYIAILNNDTMAEPQWVSSLVEAAELDDHIGAVASIIVDGNNTAVLDSVGLKVAVDGMSRQDMKGKAPPKLLAVQDVVMPSACACLLRKEALQQSGLFDERFFAYCEDTDLFLRMRWMGYTMVVAPNGVVEHLYSMTGGKFSQKKLFWVERNHYWVAIKNFPFALLAFLPIFTLWRFILQAYAVITGSGELQNFSKETSFLGVVWTVIKAITSAICGTPMMLKHRLDMRTKRKISSGKMISFLWKNRMKFKDILLIQ